MITVAIALLLDALIGDPPVPWHPVRLLGHLAAWAEKIARRLFCGGFGMVSKASPVRLRLAGMLAWFLVVIPAAMLPVLFHRALVSLGPLPAILGDSLVIWASFAIKDLVLHARRVQDALELDGEGNPVQGRQAVSMLVGRDPDRLDREGVARACIESVAESSVDSIASPLFFAIVFGPWAAFLYRAINTMDSLFGHKNERYRYFGWWAARSDDIANFIPARLSSLLACICAPLVGGHIRHALGVFFAYRKAHESPNSGHPEAAYAGALNLKLGGPTWYPEGLLQKPWINDQGRAATPADIRRAIRLLYANTALTVLLLWGGTIFISLF